MLLPAYYARNYCTPVDSYTTVLVVLTLSTTQTTRRWFQQTSFLGGV